MDSSFNRLRSLLRPAGCGIPTLITGSHHAAPLLRTLYGSHEQSAVDAAWGANWLRLTDVKCILLGIPSDTGAGLLRGSNFGPVAIRTAYLNIYGGYPSGVLDVGDVLCIPHLLHDGMLSEQQLAACRASLFPGEREALPVSPLSAAEAVVEDLRKANPLAKIVVLGGDHGITWPVLLALASAGDDFAVLQIDAHTDIAANRFGIKHCFSTWAHHALALLRPHRLVQVGVRNSARTKQEWMSLHPMLQYRSSEAQESPAEVIDGVVDYLTQHSVRQLYITNDIDGTDPQYAPATGTPEPGGLSPGFVRSLIRTIAAKFELVGGDITEVAPPLSGHSNYSSEPTCQLAAGYLDLLLRPGHHE